MSKFGIQQGLSIGWHAAQSKAVRQVCSAFGRIDMSRGCFIASAILCLAVSVASLPVDGQAVEEPSGYRLGDYYAAVPESLAGGVVVDEFDALDLIEDGNVAPIDVTGQANQSDGAASVDSSSSRDVIPGSIWLPGVGLGEIDEAVDRYYRSALHQITNGDRSEGIMIYCLPDCWMSWNAAKRAIEYGYANVYWFPNGIAGWQTVSDRVETATQYHEAQ